MKDVLNKVFKIISGFIFAILVMIIIAIICYVVRINYLAAHDRLGEIRTNFYTILTQSMHPNIKAGDIVVTYREDNNEYKKGDVITFVSRANGNINITHRIKEVYNENGLSYQTKGDNNNSVDNEIIPSEYVLGKVIFKIPKAGYIQQFLVSKTGWILAIVLPSMAIIIYDILKIFKKVYGKNNIVNDEDEEIKKRKKHLEKVLNSNDEIDSEEFLINDQEATITSQQEIKEKPVLDEELKTQDEEEEIELL